VTGLPFPLGAKPDRRDPRDFQFLVSRSRAHEASTIDRKFYTMVSPGFRIDQGNEGTCVGHAATNVLLAGPSAHPAYPAFQTEELAHQFARKLYLDGSGDATYQQGMYRETLAPSCYPMSSSSPTGRSCRSRTSSPRCSRSGR